MRITTLNLQEFTNWDVRQSVITDYIQSINPDIIVFQEVVFLPTISAFNQVQLLNQTLQYPQSHSAVTRLQLSTKYDTYREGLALLSKYPVTYTDTVILKQAAGDEHNRIVQMIDLDVEGEDVKLANIHFSLTDTVDFATAHLKETLEILEARGEERMIVGDFNLSHLEMLGDIWKEKYYCSTEFEYISFPKTNKRIDYFLIPKTYSFKNIFTSEGTVLSDHHAITADIEVA